MLAYTSAMRLWQHQVDKCAVEAVASVEFSVAAASESDPSPQPCVFNAQAKWAKPRWERTIADGRHKR